ncbi:hypothetical protein CDD83_142 [Cordyceps sp. RAO-2017]|nr:hypothetical protein CDD83_142 [Cordyceps sp. RAO-2017]
MTTHPRDALADDDGLERASLDRHGYLFGTNISRSLSPLLHRVVYRRLGLQWGQIRLDSCDIAQFLDLTQHPGFYGASVTMPNKVAILPHLDDMTDECRAVGACNTIFVRDDNGRRLLCGANTDVVGVRDSFRHNVADPSALHRNRPALVVGGGGAARSAVYALRRWMAVADIYLVNRDAAETEAMVADCARRGYGRSLVHVASVEQARGLPGPGAIVACMPDAEPRTEGERQVRSIVEVLLDRARNGVMLEMCYNPSPFTRLGALAEKYGCRVILGTEAMIWQGLEQDRYWTGMATEAMPMEEVRAAVAAKVAESSREGS